MAASKKDTVVKVNLWQYRSRIYKNFKCLYKKKKKRKQVKLEKSRLPNLQKSTDGRPATYNKLWADGPCS